MFGKGFVFAIIKGFFRLLVATLIILMVGVFVWRFITSSPGDDLTTLSPNDKLVEAYNADGELKLVTQALNNITLAPSNYGYFSVKDVVFIPEIQQLQVLVQYNDSTLKALKNDYPDRVGEVDSSKDWYDISVVLVRDLTPENEDDNLSADRESVEMTRIMPTEVSQSVHKDRYSYRRLIFDNIPTSALTIEEKNEEGHVKTDEELTLAVYLDFYFLGDVKYKIDPEFDIYTDAAYGTLCLYTYKDETVEVKLTKDDIKAIEKYK